MFSGVISQVFKQILWIIFNEEFTEIRNTLYMFLFLFFQVCITITSISFLNFCNYFFFCVILSSLSSICLGL